MRKTFFLLGLLSLGSALFDDDTSDVRQTNLTVTCFGDTPAGKTWLIGSTVNITWKLGFFGPNARATYASDTTIDIFLMYDNTFITDIALDVLATKGWYTFEVPEGTTPQKSYYLYLVDFDGNLEGQSDYFNIEYTWPPSFSPTKEPTDYPTPPPTTPPSYEPTPKPTDTPIPLPTPFPSGVPTPAPTYVPTPEPSYGPTPKPTFSPTPRPSEVPMPGPTAAPMPGPTMAPTVSPTGSGLHVIEPHSKMHGPAHSTHGGTPTTWVAGEHANITWCARMSRSVSRTAH